MSDGKMKQILVLLTVFTTVLATSNKVPVILWTNHGALKSLPGALSGHTYSKGFTTNYLDPILKSRVNNIVIFIQDMLSLEDFTQYGDVYNENGNGAAFNNLKIIMEQHKTVNLPAVRDPVHSVEYLKDRFEGQFLEWSGAGKMDHEEDLGERNLIVVNLKSRGAGTGVQNNLAENDAIIGQVMSGLDSKGASYVAMYTARQPSKVEMESPYQGHRHGRKLLATADQLNATFVNLTNCVYFHARKINFTMMTTKPGEVMSSVAWSVALPAKEQPDAGSSCGADVNKLVLKWTNPSADYLKSITFTIEFRNNTKTWNTSSFLLSYEGGTKSAGESGTNVPLVLPRVQTPMGMASSCSQPESLIANATGASFFKVTFQGYQVQSFAIPANNKFGPGDNCVGFFTIPIWSGLISGIILVSILLFGATMLLNITTMDRFDDPKGKTISVNTAEG